MNKKLASLIFLATFSTNVLTACGSDPGNVPDATSTDTQTDTTAVPTDKIATTTPAKAAATPPAKTTTTPTKTTTATTPAKTTAPVSTQTNESVAQKILLKTKQTYDGYKNFTATLTMYSKRNDKVAPSASATTTAEFKYTFQQQPKLCLLNVVKHSISLAVGGRLVWAYGATKARAKAAGALGLFPLDLDLSDSKLETNRNWRLDQVDQGSVLARALDPKATVTLTGKSTVGGRDAYVLQVKGNGLDDQVTEEDLSIDAQNFTLLADEVYAGKDLLFQLKLNQTSVNDTLAADTFIL
ncbi:MAG: hypothetical protein H7263_07690 [Candidatus Sericytochromatia bacterium]|nr:hypothetical protein [Candidatus Sericytochromatia bacterium]